MESSIAEFLLRLYACELQPTRMNLAIQFTILLPRGLVLKPAGIRQRHPSQWHPS